MINQALRNQIKKIKGSLKMRHNKTWTGFWQAGKALYKIKTDEMYKCHGKDCSFDEFCQYANIGLPGQPEHRTALASKLITIHEQLRANPNYQIAGIDKQPGLGYTEAYYLANYLKHKSEEYKPTDEIINLVSLKGANKINQKRFIEMLKSVGCKHDKPIKAMVQITCKNCGKTIKEYEKTYTPGENQQ
ncbi:MAG: hypothetical protein WCX97_00215 [Candidatus Magasanikbacteria bacterium]